VSAFREWLDAIGRITGQPVIPRGEDGQAAVERARARIADAFGVPLPMVRGDRLTDNPGPALLDYGLARCVPVSEVAPADVRRRIVGELYGREFAVWFPAREQQPPGHVWVLACWSPVDSGTHRPEVLACCRTCTVADGAHVVRGPGRCALEYAASKLDQLPPPVPPGPEG